MRRLVQRTIADSDQPKSIFGLAESASVNDVRMISGTNFASAFICLIKSYGVKLDKKPEKKTSLVFNSH